MTISLIVATSERGVIGRNNELPWHLPADLKRLKQLTTGHTIIMGRKTFESIGRPLPNRRNVIVTRNRTYRQPGATVVHSLSEALALTEGEEEVFVFGGAEIFRAALPQAQRIHRTVVHATVEGDVYFPEPDEREWALVENTRYEADERNPHPYSFQTWERRNQR